MSLYLLDLRLEQKIDITLVACSLSLEASDALLYVFFNMSKLLFGLFLSALNLTSYLVVNFLVFNGHFILKLSYLHLDNLVSPLDLEVCNLRAKGLNLFSDLFNKLATLL